MRSGPYKRGYCKALDDVHARLTQLCAQDVNLDIPEFVFAALHELDPRPARTVHLLNMRQLPRQIGESAESYSKRRFAQLHGPPMCGGKKAVRKTATPKDVTCNRCWKAMRAYKK